MSRMTRAEFLRTCAAGGIAALAIGQLPARAANNALPKVQAQRVIQHLSELPTDRAPVVMEGRRARSPFSLARGG